jgi:hypothetical protein
MMGFQNPQYLLGALAAAVPLVIFLLTRDSVKKVAFSTLRFFAGASAALIQRKRWQEALLLALRIAVCLLLAVAFARPFFRSRAAGPDGPLEVGRAVALVADVSASLAEPQAVEQLRAELAEALDEVSGDAAVTLIAFDRTPRVEVPWTQDFAHVQAQLAQLAPGAGGTDIAAAIHRADQALEQIVAPEKRIVLVSDLQRSGWEGFQGNWRLQHGVKLDLRPLPSETTAGAAIVAADYPQGLVQDGAPRPITLRIANFSAQAIAGLPVRLAINDREQETQQINLPAGAQVVVRFRSRFEQVGDNRGVVRLGTSDASTVGQTLYFNTRVIPKIEVRVLHAGGSKRPGDALFFLETALTPADDSPFVVRTQPIATTHADDLASAAVVMVADVDTASDAVQQALGAVLKRGGGLLFLPGSRAEPEAFAQAFGDLAPCKLRRVIEAGQQRRGGTKAVLAKIHFEHPILELFERPHFGDFTAVRFDRYWEVTDSQLAKVLARFDDGRPYVLEKSLHGGSSILLTSPADVRWNNLAHRAIFVPFLHQITRYLAQRTERPTGYLVGDLLPIPPKNTLREPAGQVHQGSSFSADQPGYYTVLDEAGHSLFSYAVNGDLAETNPARVDPAEIKAALEAATGAEAAAAGGLTSLAGGGRELWSYLIVAVLLLSLVELFVANRVARH